MDPGVGGVTRMRGGNEKQTRKIFIGGLNYNTTEESLKSHFSQYGELVDVVVMKFPDTKRSRGFGFVTYATEDQVDACQTARPHVIDEKTVETKRATPREEFGKPEAGQTIKKVFVGGLKEDVNDEDMRTYFSQFGNVVEITRLTERDTGKKRGFGFVEFDDYDPVDKCILKGNHQIGGRRVDVKKAVSKQELNTMSQMRGGPRGPPRGRGGWSHRGGSFGSNGWGGPPQNQWSNDNYGWDDYGQGGGGGSGGWQSGWSNSHSNGDDHWGGGGGPYGYHSAGDSYSNGGGGYGGGGAMRSSRGGYRSSPYGAPNQGLGFRGGSRGYGRP